MRLGFDSPPARLYTITFATLTLNVARDVITMLDVQSNVSYDNLRMAKCTRSFEQHCRGKFFSETLAHHF